MGARLVQLVGLERAEVPRLRYGPAPILLAAGLFELAVVLTAQLGSALGVPLGVWRPTVVVPLSVVAPPCWRPAYCRRTAGFATPSDGHARRPR